MKSRVITYGVGGYDPTKPNNNIIEDVEIEVEQQPLDSNGVLLCLLVVKGVLTLEEATSFSGLASEQLIEEVLAWEAAQAGVNNAS